MTFSFFRYYHVFGTKKAIFLLSLQITFYKVACPFSCTRPPFRKAITISNSVSRSSINLDCSEIDSPDEIIRFEQRSGLYADNGLGLKYILVPSQKL